MSRCFCIGPQNGEPLCPCRMKHTKTIDGELYEKVNDTERLKGFEVVIDPKLKENEFKFVSKD